MFRCLNDHFLLQYFSDEFINVPLLQLQTQKVGWEGGGSNRGDFWLVPLFYTLLFLLPQTYTTSSFCFLEAWGWGVVMAFDTFWSQNSPLWSAYKRWPITSQKAVHWRPEAGKHTTGLAEDLWVTTSLYSACYNHDAHHSET